MELVLIVAVVGLVLFLMLRPRQGFVDPKSMDNQQIFAAIAGQAEWLEKMSRAPDSSQQATSVIEIARKRRLYIASLCLEIIYRADKDKGPKYPGQPENEGPFTETALYATELRKQGYSTENSAVKAVKEKLFNTAGVVYPTSWES